MLSRFYQNRFLQLHARLEMIFFALTTTHSSVQIWQLAIIWIMVLATLNSVNLTSILIISLTPPLIYGIFISIFLFHVILTLIVWYTTRLSLMVDRIISTF